MSAKQPVYELARELEMPSKDLVKAINDGKLNFSVKSHSSRLTADEVAQVRKLFSKGGAAKTKKAKASTSTAPKKTTKKTKTAAPKAKSTKQERVAKDICAKQKGVIFRECSKEGACSTKGKC